MREHGQHPAQSDQHFQAYPRASRKARVTGPVAGRAVQSGQKAVSAGTEPLHIYDRSSADLSHSETMIIRWFFFSKTSGRDLAKRPEFLVTYQSLVFHTLKL
jgi:hypothetical protein